MIVTLLLIVRVGKSRQLVGLVMGQTGPHGCPAVADSKYSSVPHGVRSHSHLSFSASKLPIYGVKNCGEEWD